MLVMGGAAGCASTSSRGDDTEVSAQSTEVRDAGALDSGKSTASTSVTDAETCTAFGDVTTILANADTALAEQRMAKQEQQGWYRLATRVLHRVPTSGSGDVSDAVLALQEAVPVIALGAGYTAEFGSPEWRSGVEALIAACDRAGTELATAMFTGG